MTGIIILNYNGSSDTIKCVGSIIEHNTAPVKLIIIDNGSTKAGEAETLDSYLAETFGDQYRKVDEGAPAHTLTPVTFLASKTNSGYAGGNNKGLRLAFADDEITDIIILNNDILFTSDIIPTLYEVREQAVKPAILTPLLIDRRGNWEQNCARTVPTSWDVILPFLMFKKNKRQILTKRANAQMMLVLKYIDNEISLHHWPRSVSLRSGFPAALSCSWTKDCSANWAVSMKGPSFTSKRTSSVRKSTRRGTGITACPS